MCEVKNYNKQTLKYYETHSKEYFDKTVSLNMSAAYQLFLKYSTPKTKILDAGSGSGRDTKVFLDLGYEVVALDASLELSKISTAYTGQKTLHLALDEIAFKEEFDALWVSAVLVHFQKYHLFEVMENLKRALKPKGIWFMSFRYGKESLFEGERFFLYQTERSISQLISRLQGLELIEYNFHENSLNGMMWINVMVRKI